MSQNIRTVSYLYSKIQFSNALTLPASILIILDILS